MKRFTDKVAVVTGAGSGIGRALALDLAGRGARLALSDVDSVRAAETAALCEKVGARVRAYELDVADRAAVQAHADEVAGEFGVVNLVINNAGVALSANVEEMDWADFDWLMGINFGGVVNGTKAFLPHLIASGEGHLVNISSMLGLIGMPTQSAYNAAKFAVRGFTEALRLEMLMARHPVQVSCVHPGGVKTNIARDSRNMDESDSDSAAGAAAFDQFARTSPEKAAQTILKGVERNSARILIGKDAYVMDAIPRLLGSAYQRPLAMLGRVMLKQL